jgi:Zn-dependent alcohol dehydrogenase
VKIQAAVAWQAGAPLHYLAGFTCGVQTDAGAILNAMPVTSRSRVAVWGAGAVGKAVGRGLSDSPPRP